MNMRLQIVCSYILMQIGLHACKWLASKASDDRNVELWMRQRGARVRRRGFSTSQIRGEKPGRSCTMEWIHQLREAGDRIERLNTDLEYFAVGPGSSQASTV